MIGYRAYLVLGIALAGCWSQEPAKATADLEEGYRLLQSLARQIDENDLGEAWATALLLETKFRIGSLAGLDHLAFWEYGDDVVLGCV